MAHETASPTLPPAQRSDMLALVGGILFSALFTGLIAWGGARLEAIPHLPDQGASWYYWMLIEPTTWSRATAWGFYAAHQITFWGLIWYGQTHVKRYKAGLHPVNIAALALNAAFILLHFVQTHIWYDGLAQDVSIWSSQGSVVLLLVMVLLMENSRRGLFFGHKAPLSQRAIRWARTYHGYIFSWAAVYTFWYHPMEATSGHLIGFFYMFFLMLQGSLFFTRVHINRNWTLLQELLVLPHGTLVAVMNGNNLWPMFFFGFAGIFVITQVHGLGWPRWARGATIALYLALVLLVYAERGWGRLDEVIRIPVIEYLFVFLLSAIFGGGSWLFQRFTTSASPAPDSVPG